MSKTELLTKVPNAKMFKMQMVIKQFTSCGCETIKTVTHLNLTDTLVNEGADIEKMITFVITF